MSLKKEIEKQMKGEFKIKDVYEKFPNTPKTTVRARLYDSLGISFDRIAKGVYRSIEKDRACVLLEGDGRVLDFIEDESIDCIITDHPWEDTKSNSGGSRNFDNTYESFRYTIEDFKEKARVLKKGSFLVEFIPAENENNFEYLYEIKKMAKECGLLYYSKVPWKKGNFISNTGRKSKNTEDVLIFSKGKARSLRVDVKKTKGSETIQFMSGTNGMLPTCFDFQSVSKTDRTHQAEKPILLYQEIIKFVTKENEVILDQFAGSGNLGVASIISNRKCILIEKCKDFVENIKIKIKAPEINYV